MRGFIKVGDLTKERIAADIANARKVSARIQKSKKWVPLKLVVPKDATGTETWQNPWYDVRVARFSDGWPIGGGPWARIGISCEDGEPRHDWRVFQKIKNQVAGDEWWAIEIYPAESQLMDPSNYFLLWAAPSLPAFGDPCGRVLAGPSNCVAYQRGWHPDDEPREVRDGITNWPGGKKFP